MRRRRTDPAEIRFWSKIIGALFIVLLVTVWEHVQALNVERQIKMLRAETDRFAYENGRMDMQIHQWESPSHLDVVARHDFQMIPLDAPHVIGLNP